MKKCRCCKNMTDVTMGTYAGSANDLFFCGRCIWHLAREFKLTGRPQTEAEGIRWMEEQYGEVQVAA